MAFLRMGNQKVYHDACGTGDVLLFLHDEHGSAINWWPQVHPLSKHFKCVVMDFRGFGNSYPVTDGFLDLTTYAHDCVALLDHFGAAEAGIVSAGMGAAVALHLANEQPNRISKVVACSPLIDWHGDRLKKTELALSHSDTVKTQFSAAFQEGEPEIVWLAQQVNAFNSFALREMPSEGLKRKLSFKNNSLGKCNLSDVTAPVLFVLGDQPRSDATMAAYDDLQKLIKASKLATIEGAGRFPQVEKPSKFNALALEFLSA